MNRLFGVCQRNEILIKFARYKAGNGRLVLTVF